MYGQFFDLSFKVRLTNLRLPKETVETTFPNTDTVFSG